MCTTTTNKWTNKQEINLSIHVYNNKQMDKQNNNNNKKKHKKVPTKCYKKRPAA